MSANVDLNNRPDYDQVLQDIADYVLNYKIESVQALDTARRVSGASPLAMRFCDKWSATARMPPRLSEGCPHSAASQVSL